MEQQMEARISKLEDKINALDKDSGVLTVLLQKNSESQEKVSEAIVKLNDTMGDMKVTMNSMQTEIKDSMEQICETRKEIAHVKEMVNKVDEKGKIDWMQIVKDNIIKVLVTGGAFATIITVADKVIAAIVPTIK